MKHLMNTLLVCFLMTGIAFACPPDGDGDKAEAKVEKSENAAMVQFTDLNLSVKGMTCAGCENKVRAALTGIDGVVETKKVCAESDQASLSYDPNVVTEAEIMTILKEKTGYSIEVIKSAGMTEADAVKKECSAAEKKECAKSKTSCAKAKASADMELEEEE